MTWAEGGHPTDWDTQAPQPSFILNKDVVSTGANHSQPH